MPGQQQVVNVSGLSVLCVQTHTKRLRTTGLGASRAPLHPILGLPGDLQSSDLHREILGWQPNKTTLNNSFLSAIYSLTFSTRCNKLLCVAQVFNSGQQFLVLINLGLQFLCILSALFLFYYLLVVSVVAGLWDIKQVMPVGIKWGWWTSSYFPRYI